ncbi:UNVERIFIED_CONTAM: replication initiator protein A, partial [Bacteroidetes bacterium 56_B9]
REVLDYSPNYFQIGPVERRLYEVARASCANGAIDVDIEDLRLQIGYQNPVKNFRHALKGIAEEDSIPDYRIVLGDNTNEDVKRKRGP